MGWDGMRHDAMRCVCCALTCWVMAMMVDGKASTRDKISVDTENSVDKMEKRVGGDGRRRDSHDDKMRRA